MAETKSLAQIELFADLDQDTLARLDARCRWRRYKAGERILEYGSEAREVFFIVEGSVHIVNTGLTGRDVAFARIYGGDCFGELSAIDGKPRSASAVAAEPAFVALLPASEFHRLLEERVEVTFKVLFRLAQMVRAGDVRIMELSTLAATQRVYAEILRMAQPDAAVDGLWVVRPLPPLREIASRVSTTRETVARALSQLYGNDLLRRKGRNLYLMDRQKLVDILAASSAPKAT